MSNTGKQSPLGVNTLSSLLQDIGFNINPITVQYAGSSTSAGSYTLGDICQNTCLRLQTYGINAAYTGGNVNSTTYNNLISIGAQASTTSTISITSTTTNFTVTYSGSAFPPTTIIRIDGVTPSAYNGSWEITSSSTGSFTVTSTLNPGTATIQGTVYYGTSIPGLGNAKAISYTWQDAPSWGGTLYNASNSATQWGYIRLFPWQAYNDFNFNNGLPAYKDFLQSFMISANFINYSNDAILAMSNSRYFLDGTYSNMDDLISGDITGVNLAGVAFGQDLIKGGKAINLAKINTFGLPSNLLETLQQNNGLTKAVTLALIASGLTTSEIGEILGNVATPTVGQQKKMYNAFTIILGNDLQEVLTALNCKVLDTTTDSLADLLNPMKLFPTSYASLTVPVYNTQPNTPTNSKTYYPIYSTSAVNPVLSAPSIQDQIGTSPYASAQVATSYIAPDNRNSTGSTTATPYSTSSPSGSNSIQSSPTVNFQTASGSSSVVDSNQDINGTNLTNSQSGREYLARQYYDPPLTGAASLPMDVRRALIREYIATHTTLSPDQPISFGPDGGISFTDTNFKLPEGVNEFVTRVATAKGMLDANGQSTLPPDNYQLAERIQRDAQITRGLPGNRVAMAGNSNYIGSLGDTQAAASSTNASAAAAAVGGNTSSQTNISVAPSAPTGVNLKIEDDPGLTSLVNFDPKFNPKNYSGV